MTRPGQPNPPTTPAPESAVPAVVRRHDLAAEALEAEAVKLAVGTLLARITALLGVFRSRWLREFGDPRDRQSGPRFRALMADLATGLGELHVDPAPVLLEHAERAQRLGIEQGWREVGHTPGVHLALGVPTSTHTYAVTVAQQARDQLATAQSVADATTRGSFTAVQAATAPARAAASTVEGAVRTVVNERLNAGIGAVADYLGGDKLWVSERNSCLTCAALSGTLADSEGLFDVDATFGAKPIAWLPEFGLVGPPRHPRCRCRITPWIPDQPSPPGGVDLPMALRREAERSVLRGFALPSESGSERTRAADRLLTTISSRHGVAPSGWQVPRSVRTSTEKRIKKGTFGVTPFPGKR